MRAAVSPEGVMLMRDRHRQTSRRLWRWVQNCSWGIWIVWSTRKRFMTPLARLEIWFLLLRYVYPSVNLRDLKQY
jgi:uncharacterized membrane protein